MDLQLKKEKWEFRKEEREKQFEEQMAMRQHLSEVLKSFTDM